MTCYLYFMLPYYISILCLTNIGPIYIFHFRVKNQYQMHKIRWTSLAYLMSHILTIIVCMLNFCHAKCTTASFTVHAAQKPWARLGLGLYPHAFFGGGGGGYNVRLFTRAQFASNFLLKTIPIYMQTGLILAGSRATKTKFVYQGSGKESYSHFPIRISTKSHCPKAQIPLTAQILFFWWWIPVPMHEIPFSQPKISEFQFQLVINCL